MGKVSRKNGLRLYQPPRVKHVVQLGPPEPDCGVACAAMIAGAEYIVAWVEANTVSPLWPRWGLSSGNMVAILRELTDTEWCYRSLPRPRPLLANAVWPSRLSVCIIRKDGDKKGHLIVYNPHGKWVYDPAWHCGVRLKTYLGMLEDGIRLIGYVERADPEEPGGAA